LPTILIGSRRSRRSWTRKRKEGTNYEPFTAKGREWLLLLILILLILFWPSLAGCASQAGRHPDSHILKLRTSSHEVATAHPNFTIGGSPFGPRCIKSGRDVRTYPDSILIRGRSASVATSNINRDITQIFAVIDRWSSYISNWLPHVNGLRQLSDTRQLIDAAGTSLSGALSACQQTALTSTYRLTVLSAIGK